MEILYRHSLGKLGNFSSYLIFSMLFFFLLLSTHKNLSTNIHRDSGTLSPMEIITLFLNLVRCFEETVQSLGFSIILRVKKE